MVLTVLDEFGNRKRDTVYGTKFGINHVRHPNANEQVILDVFHITTGDNHEAAAVERSVEKLLTLAPHLGGVTYDMAMRGPNREHLFDLGIQLITKCPRLRKDEPRTQLLGMKHARKSDGTLEDVAVWAIDGAPHVEVIVGSERQHVRLERVRTQRRENKRARERGLRPFRWYNHYRIPDDPRVSARLRRARLTLRVDDPDHKTSRISRADSLHSIAPGDEDWHRIFALRNGTESINALIKSKLQGRRARAPAVGARRQHLALLGFALYTNFQAAIAHAERLERTAA